MKKQAKKVTAVKTVKLPPIEKKLVAPTLVREKITPDQIKEKIVMLTKIPIPDGHIRSIVLIGHVGMLEYHNVGDIVDFPERRFKTLANRGLVKKYEGDGQPNKKR